MISPGLPLESAIARKIAEHISKRNTFFVFPTQVSADSWAKVSLRLPGAIAIEMERFLGWDDFLDLAAAANIPSARRRADQKSRLLWALQVLNEQIERPFLASFAKPGFAPTLPLAARLARLAPSLRQIASAARNLSPEALGLANKEDVADYLAIAERYSQFLDRQGLYEPGHLKPAKRGTDHFILFEPSLMPGFAQLSALLEEGFSLEIWREERPAVEGKSPAPTLLKFGTIREEMRYILANCSELLDKGMEPADIAISVPANSPEFQAHLQLLARQFALPLDFRAGQPLSVCPFGRLLASLSRASAEGFSTRTMEGLFGRGPFRWKEEASVSMLLRYAKRYHIPEFSADRHSMAALWNKTFSLCPGESEAAFNFYASLRKAALSIEGAKTFASLERALYDFKNGFLADDELPPEADRTLARVFEELIALGEWHSRFGNPTLAGTPFEILLLELGITTYNSATSGTTNAISVYPFHLGMLLANPVHFVMDVSQDALDPALRYLSRLPAELAPLLGEEADISAALLSSFGAVSAVYCHAERNLSGYSVPHPYFSHEGVTKIAVRSADIPPLFDSQEALAWRESAARLLPIAQPAGRREAALGIFSLDDGTGRTLPPPALEARRGQARKALDPGRLWKLPACDASPRLKLSPARLKKMTQCPFKWFSTCVPGIDEGPTAIADLAEGSLSHALISALLQEIEERDGGFIPLHKEEYLRWLDASFDRVLRSVSRQNGPSLEPALEAAYPKIRHRIAHLLEFETEFSEEGWDIGEFEVSLSRTYEDLGLVIEGRADRIARRRENPSVSGVSDVVSGAGAAGDDTGDTIGGGSESYAVIDFKKKSTPARKDFLVDKEGRLRDFQIASYVSMLEGAGKRVSRALYWSIEESRPTTVFGPAGARDSSEAFEPEREALSAALASVSHIVSEGSFLAISPSAEGCESCPIRPICRAHYSSERA